MCNHMAKISQGLKGQKEVCFVHITMDLHFFSLLVFAMVLHDVICNVATLI
jgi:hypothetical protein